MLSDEFDLGGEAPSGEVAGLHALLREAIQLDNTIEDMEESLKAFKVRLHKLRTGDIPEKMTELGFEKLEFNGFDVSIADFVSGSLPKDPEARQKAVRWLEDHEGGDLIKTLLTVEFGKKEHNSAINARELLKEQGYNPDLASGVHPQTLAAFARERIRNGEPIEPEVLGLYVGRVAQLKVVKPKGGKR